MAPYPAFIGVSDTPQSLTSNAERTVNFYYETLPQNAKNRAALYPTPGFAAWTTVTDIGGRELFTENGRTLGVIGVGLYEFFQDGTFSRRGDVLQDSNPAQIVTNGAAGGQALIASGGNGYLLNLTTNSLSQVLTGDCVQIGMLDGYFIAFNPATSKIRLSNLNDGTTWDPTQFAQRSAAADNWKGMIVNQPDVFLIGGVTGDVWYDAGTFPFPLAPRVGLNFKFGLASSFSLKASGPSAMWLSVNRDGAGIVVRSRGYTPQPVSTLPLETAISNYQRTSTITDAEAFVYQQEGHTFYVLSFPNANATWVYDLDENKWAERSYWNPSQNREDLWRPRVHTYAFGMHLTADRVSGIISKMDVQLGTETDGTAIRRLRRAQQSFVEHRQQPVRNVELYLETGIATATGQGSNPLVMWRTSDDGGKTWGSERQIPAGKIGNYKARVRIWRLGMPRDRVNEMVVSDPIPWRLTAAYVNNDVPAEG